MTAWEIVDSSGRVVRTGDGAVVPAINSLAPGESIRPASEPSVEARLKILEDRADTHADQISELMARIPDVQQLVSVEHPSDLIEHNLDALLLWSHPEAWNIGGSPEERLRMRTVLDQIHRAVQQAHRGERVETPDEVAMRQSTEPPPTVVG